MFCSDISGFSLFPKKLLEDDPLVDDNIRCWKVDKPAGLTWLDESLVWVDVRKVYWCARSVVGGVGWRVTSILFSF